MKSVKLNIIIYIFNLIILMSEEPEPAPASAAHIGTRGNKIGNDSSGNLIIKTISGNFLEMSCNEVKIDKDLNVYGNVDICGVLKINDYSFPRSSNGYGDKVLKLNANATQLEWRDTNLYRKENILQIGGISGGNILFDNILLTDDELLNIQSVHTLENGFLKAKQGTQLFLDSHIIPTLDETFDLGSAEYKIRHLFLSDNSLWIGDEHKIDVSNGELKFKKRKKNFIPQRIKDLSNSLNTIDDIKKLSNKFNNINDLSSMKLNDWLLVNKELKKLNPTIQELYIEDIFNDSPENWVQDLNQNEKIAELEDKIDLLTSKLNTLLNAGGYQQI